MKFFQSNREKYYDLFEELADKLEEGAKLFTEIIANYEYSEFKVGKLKEFREPTAASQLLAASQKPEEAALAALSFGMQGFGQMKKKRRKERRDKKGSFATEYGEDGLSTAWHFVAENPLQELLEYVEELQIPVDEGNVRGDTPFMKMICSHRTRPYLERETVYPFLKRHKVDIDKANAAGTTPFLQMIQRHDFGWAYGLLDEGANVNANDLLSNFALKCTVMQNDVVNTRKLLEGYKADVDKRDKHLRTVLHHAINNSSPMIDSTSDMENLLLDFGADVNAVDIRGRSPSEHPVALQKDSIKNPAIHGANYRGF